MKKIEYKEPVLNVITMNYKKSLLLTVSGETPGKDDNYYEGE